MFFFFFKAKAPVPPPSAFPSCASAVVPSGRSAHNGWKKNPYVQRCISVGIIVQIVGVGVVTFGLFYLRMAKRLAKPVVDWLN